MKRYQKDALAKIGVTTQNYRVQPGEDGRDAWASGLLLIKDWGTSTQREFGCVEQYYVDDRGGFYAYDKKPVKENRPIKRLGRFRSQREAIAAIVAHQIGMPSRAPRQVGRRNFRPVADLNYDKEPA